MGCVRMEKESPQHLSAPRPSLRHQPKQSSEVPTSHQLHPLYIHTTFPLSPMQSGLPQCCSKSSPGSQLLHSLHAHDSTLHYSVSSGRGCSPNLRTKPQDMAQQCCRWERNNKVVSERKIRNPCPKFLLSDDVT